MESTPTQIAESLAESLTEMYKGYLASDGNEYSEKLERMKIFDHYLEIMELIKKQGMESEE